MFKKNQTNYTRNARRFYSFASIDLDNPDPVLENNGAREKKLHEIQTNKRNSHGTNQRQNLKTIKQVSAKRTIVFCFGVSCLCVCTLAFAPALNRAAMRNSERSLCMSVFVCCLRARLFSTNGSVHFCQCNAVQIVERCASRLQFSQRTITIILWTTYKFDKCPKSARLIAIKLHAHYVSNQVVCAIHGLPLSHPANTNTKTKCTESKTMPEHITATKEFWAKKKWPAAMTKAMATGTATGTNDNCWKFNWKNNDGFVFCVLSLKWFVRNEMNLRKFDAQKKKNQIIFVILIVLFSVVAKWLRRIMCSMSLGMKTVWRICKLRDDQLSTGIFYPLTLLWRDKLENK